MNEMISLMTWICLGTSVLIFILFQILSFVYRKKEEEQLCMAEKACLCMLFLLMIEWLLLFYSIGVVWAFAETEKTVSIIFILTICMVATVIIGIKILCSSVKMFGNFSDRHASDSEKEKIIRKKKIAERMKVYTQLLAFVKGYLRIGFILFLGIGIVDAIVGIVSGYLSIDHFAELLSKALSVDCFPAVSKESLPHFMGIAVNLFIGAVCSEFLRGKVNQFGKKLESLIETSE